jgi:PAS domain S-box-containing protein
MFACSAEKALGQPVHRFIPKELSLPIKGACDADLSTSSLTVLFRYGSRGVRADGASFPLEASLSKGQIDGRKFYTLVVRDITDRRRAEERIEEQAELLNIANDAIVVRDLEDRITYWNQGAERLYGWSESQALGRHAAEIMDKPLSPELDQAHTALRTVGEWSGELRQIAKDGTELIVASRWKVVRDQADVPKAKLIINTDITEKKRLEMQFLHSQKLEAIGTLAGGVAHDFNNLLTVIAGFSDLLLKRAPLDEANAELLREIRKASDKASILTRQLLAFSRKQMLRPQVVDLNQLIEDMRNMLRRLIGEDIQFLARLHERPCPVKADPGQLEQVVLNLVVNARDAMPTGGRLEIETSIQDLPSAAASGPSSMEPGRYARLSLTDSGHGMSPQTKARIFEPFFTTKEVGKGTGLGLAAVYGIVKQSGGQVEVDSAPGTGTRFTIYLPCVESVPAPPRKSSAILGVLHATETILLVEDEECVRTLARHTLQANGYEVIEAKDGAEALTMARDHDGPIHALVTDVVMPKLSGRELAEALGRQRPAVKVLYLSGYTGEAIRRYGVSDEEMDVLQKPFSPMELARRVREMLDRASSIPCPETLE